MDKKKIFIIDDDPSFLKLLKILFEKESYQVIVNRNYADICHKIKESRPDIVLLDLLMPDNSGFQIFKQMKKDKFCATIPVVVLTSHQNFNSKIQLLREGVLDYIYKPFRKEELLLRMRNYIQYCSNGKTQPFDEDLILNQLSEILTARNKKWLEPKLDKKSLYGYIYEDIRLVSDFPIYGKERDLLEEWAGRNLLTRELVDIVELCPVCYHYNVAVNYLCPICKSINIEENSVVGEENHVYRCNDCGMNIKLPKNRYHCLNCDERFDRDKVVRQKIYRYQVLSSDTGEKSANNKPIARSVVPADHFNSNNNNNRGMLSLPGTSEAPARIYRGNSNFIYAALKQTNVPYVLPNRFRDRITNEIRFAEYDDADVTVMSVGIENLYQLTMKFKSESILKIFKGILHTIIRHLRPQDVLSFNGEQHQFLVMLPNTHLKMAKIIAGRIQQKLDRFRTAFPLEINLASFPQDGRTVDEIFAMLELGIEQVSSHAFS